MALVELDALLRCLEVEQLDEETWTAPNLEMDYRRIFGGQLLAQAVVLSHETTPEKSVRSLHCLFPREGDLDRPLRYTVEATHDGRTFATRRVIASQANSQGVDKPFFVATISLHAAEPGLEHHDPRPDVGSPDAAEAVDLSMIPWENRVVDGVDLGDRAAAPADYAFWTRVGDRRLPNDVAVHEALLAYATDLTVIGTALRPHDGYSQADSTVSLHTAVTGHSIWFHGPFRIDDWCLVSQHSPVTAGGRAFGVGQVHDMTGRLVANFAQDAMIRVQTSD